MPQDVDPAAVIEFSLFANKLFGAVLVGSTHVLLSTLLEQETSDKWYTLKCKSQDVGSVRVKTSVTRRFKDVPTTQLRDPPPSGSVLQSATRPSPVKIMPPQSSLFSSMRQGQSLAGSLPARDTSQHHSAAASPSRTPGSGVVSRAAATFSYKVGEMVGRGAFGKVFMAMNLVTGELMAVKCVELTDIAKEELEEIQNEVALLRQLKHRHVVQYIGTHSIETSLNILMEFCPGGSVSSLCESFGAFPETVLALYCRQMAEGVAYVHSQNVMHRDIKGANILVAANGLLKLADFGASAQLRGTTGQGLTSMAGTPYWMAPEVIRQERYGRPADCWSMGMTIIEMATGTHPWPAATNKFSLMFQIAQSTDFPPFPETLSTDCKDLILKCINRDVDKRISAEACLSHPWLARITTGLSSA